MHNLLNFLQMAVLHRRLSYDVFWQQEASCPLMYN